LAKVRAGRVWQLIARPLRKRGNGGVRRCGFAAPLHWHKGAVLGRSGALMRGRLRRPYRPLQVIGVLAAVLPIATISLQLPSPAERAGTQPITKKPTLGEMGERLSHPPWRL